MKKLYLLMVLVVVCATFYGVSEIYASVSTQGALPNCTQQIISITNGYMTPYPQPIRRVYGDPIQDPRPKMARLPRML